MQWFHANLNTWYKCWNLGILIPRGRQNHYLIDIDDWQNECEFHDLDHFEFDIGIEPDRRTCTWWTIDEMRADPRMRAVNGDLIGTLELIESGLLPAPSMAG